MTIRTAKIIVTNAEYSNADRPIEVYYNGKPYILKPGLETTVPEGVMNILRDANYKTVEAGASGNVYENDQFVGVTKTKKRYNLVVLYDPGRGRQGRMSEADKAESEKVIAEEKKLNRKLAAEDVSFLRAEAKRRAEAIEQDEVEALLEKRKADRKKQVETELDEFETTEPEVEPEESEESEEAEEPEEPEEPEE
jgi:hypothetical protein